jgi:UDP-glucose 4-epimerase
VARANYLAFEKDVGGPINIGTGVETDINTLYRLLADAAEVGAGPVHAPAKPGEQMRSCVDASRARELLGWSPSMGLSDGLRETLRFFREKSGGGRPGGVR